MNARSYRSNVTLSPLDFPSITGLGQSSISYQSEPHLNGKTLKLTITKKYVLTDMSTNKEHEILSVKLDYEIPSNLVKTREDVYGFYRDATLGLKEAYHYIRTQLPELPNIPFPIQPIENYAREIDRVFNLLNRQN
jgi:hypothetical protein